MRASLPLGGVIGMAEIVDVVRRHGSPWFFGPWGIVLAKARPINLAPSAGKLGLFDLDETRLGIGTPAPAGQGRML